MIFSEKKQIESRIGDPRGHRVHSGFGNRDATKIACDVLFEIGRKHVQARRYLI